MDMEKETEVQMKRYQKVEAQVNEEAAKKRRIGLDADERKRIEEEELKVLLNDIDELADFNAREAQLFRHYWYSLTEAPFGSYEDETTIRAKRFTDECAPCGGHARTTLQIFSVKVAGLRGGLKLPLDVYGVVAVRDHLDQKRNILFHRKRDNCQTLTQKDASLVLTGPTRAVMFRDTVVFEVELKVRNKIESEDRVISFLAARIRSDALFPYSCLFKDYKSKLSTLELTLGHIFYCVEATVSVQVTEGSWRHETRGQFAARTASIEGAKVVLLDFGDEKVSLDGGNISLSRSVVSVELDEKLIVCVQTCQSDKAKDEVIEDRVEFTPLHMGRSRGELNVGFCKMEVTVAWSLFLDSVNKDFCCNFAAKAAL